MAPVQISWPDSILSISLYRGAVSSVVVVGCIVEPTPAQPAVCHGHVHGPGQFMVGFDLAQILVVIRVGLWCVGSGSCCCVL